MNFQPLIDNAPYILIGLGFLLWALARLGEAKAKANPAIDKWDEWQPRLSWAAHLYSQALDWLCDTGNLQLTGQAKLAELNRLVRAFEGMVANGEYLEAVNGVIGYWTAAKGKLSKLLPPASVPPVGSPKAGDSGSR